jgi:hypothetical protein
MISGLVNNPNFQETYLTNNNDSKYEFFFTCKSLFLLSKNFKGKSYNENAKMALLKWILESVIILVLHEVYI